LTNEQFNELATGFPCHLRSLEFEYIVNKQHCIIILLFLVVLSTMSNPEEQVQIIRVGLYVLSDLPKSTSSEKY